MPRTRTATSREEKIDELLDAADGLFAQHGFAGTSTAQLARAAGVSEKTLFWYFPSKEHLLVAVVDRASARLAGGLRRRGWPRGDLADDLYRLLRAMRSIRHLLPVMHQRAEVSTHVAASRDRYRLAHHHAIASSLRAMRVPESEVDDAVMIIVSFADGVLLRNVGDRELRSLCDTLVGRLARRSSKSSRNHPARRVGHGARPKHSP